MPDRRDTGYTLGMQWSGILIRAVLALWLCVGTQVHVALDHAALFQHATHHLEETEAAGDANGYIAHDDTLCCYHTPQHQHHDNGTPHAHLVEALPSSSAKRTLNTLAVDQITTQVFLLEVCAAPPVVLTSVFLPSDAPDTCNAALRGPPSA